jgi:hypothetical protein
MKMNNPNHQFRPSGANYKPNSAGFTKAEFDFLKAYLNGAHDNNYQLCQGVPSSSGADTVIRHSVASYAGTFGSTSVGIIVTGIPEAPIIIKNSTNVAVIPYANMPWPADATYLTRGPDFLKTHGVGAYRCASLNVKIEDETAEVYQTGHILAVRNPAAIDMTYIQDNGLASLPYAQLGIRVVESIPDSDDDCTSISSNVYNGKSRDGLYAVLPYNEPLCPFIQRDCPDNKAVYSHGGSASNINASVYSLGHPLAVKYGKEPSIYLPLTNGSTPSETYAVVNSIQCSPSNMQSLMIFGSGLDATHTTWRITVQATWEFVTAVGSDLSDLMKAPMPTNLGVLTAASEVFRGMPAAYPASANFWNEIWDKFKDVYQTLSPMAGKLISALPPSMGAPAGIAKGVLDILTDTKKEVKEATKAMKGAKSSLQGASASASRKKDGGR